ncbi:SDR family oxidoreductase [Haloterrigena alkaliphila]|uniref:SDR family oxidoreductase n=1 Tax=Haloterrigena alkaliphila TaxID=2816475 RepID=A0A8A2V9D1_9EURY|nr:SDR family oxidoreductase [Haloterrigena alkaliphila]QSW98629.1 SDR family oxidoreductase [Haloterrigena alkaliphila]
MSEPIDSEVVVVTGASAGVGRATARAFAERGAKIGLLARGEDGLEGAREDVEAAGGEAIAVPTDVADPDAVEAAAETVEDAFGPIDVWVNNAMVSVFSPAAEMTADDYRRVTEVTYLGYVYGTQAALERMRPRDEGTIVQVGSALAYRGIPLQSAYCGAKHAIQGYTESVRTELIHDDCDVQLSMVQMPAMNTPQFEWTKSRLPKKSQPVPPIYQPEVAARAIRWTVDHERDELWVGRSTVKAIVGNRLIPRRLDNLLASGGYDSQQTDEPVDPDREHNLYGPVDGDFGARGPFDDRARERSYQLQASMHRRALALLAGIAVAIVGAVVGRRLESNGSN